ncbi:hypothetical protein DL96DRAFT_1702475 [Flagelloscypha sp. PMI_526]|nr:hypothetical protein DL96DRAFT_1702475 [Flagelloscypha sp. PMI_526]
MAVRNPRKGEEAKASLLTEPSIQALPLQPKIEIIPLDLGSFQSARTFSDTLNARYDYLDIVLLNAGAGFVDFRETTDGYEELLQVNYLSNSLLAVLVYPLLQAGWNNSPSAPTRLTIVGSSAQFGASFSDKPPPPTALLSNTSILYLTEKNIYGKVIVNLTCPGMLANSSMTDELPFGIRQLAGAVKKFRGRSPEQAGVSTVYAIAEAGEESQGKLIFHNQIQPTTPFALTDVGRDMEKRLWTETVEFLDNQVPGCFERFY